MSIKLKKYLKITTVLVILLLALFLRVYKLEESPPSLNWDEVANAYNAYSIAYYGMDEWGQKFPLVFTSFRDDKNPVHIYITAIFFRLFGVSDFMARFSSAFFGVLSVLVLFLLTKQLFKNEIIAYFAAFSLAISPYNIHFSRGLWESNFALFFLLLGLWLFYIGLEIKKWFLPLSAVSFGVSILAVQSSKVVVIPIVLFLVILYLRKLIRLGNAFFIHLIILSIFAFLLLLEPRLLGTARIGQTKFSDELISKTFLYQRTQNTQLGYLEAALKQYPKHFGYQYLFERGDQYPRESIKNFGQFYKIDLIFLIVGMFFMLFQKSRFVLVFILWFLLSPLPSTLVTNSPSAHRAFFIMGISNIFIGFGIYKSIVYLRSRYLKIILIIVLLAIYGISLKDYMYSYLNIYPKSEAIQWQYGMKQIVEFVKKNLEYSRVYMTDVRSQPYIFFLYYLRVPPTEFQKNVIYNSDDRNKSYNLVYSFDRYQFGGWDEVQSMPDPNILYIIEEGKYGGLAYKNDFARVEPIKFPNGDIAFYIVGRY